jgi:hypothetical protein
MAEVPTLNLPIILAINISISCSCELPPLTSFSGGYFERKNSIDFYCVIARPDLRFGIEDCGKIASWCPKRDQIYDGKGEEELVRRGPIMTIVSYVPYIPLRY